MPHEVKTVLRRWPATPRCGEPAMTPDVTAILRQADLLRSVHAACRLSPGHPGCGSSAGARSCSLLVTRATVWSWSSPAGSRWWSVPPAAASSHWQSSSRVACSANSASPTAAPGPPTPKPWRNAVCCSSRAKRSTICVCACRRWRRPWRACSRPPAAAHRGRHRTWCSWICRAAPRRSCSASPGATTASLGQKMGQQEFAHQVAGARQSVNAALRSFERRGWIEVHDRAVTVKQPAALSRFAGHEVSASGL